MRHYYSVHCNSPNFFVKCDINSCPATYRRYHSFYKHVVRNHAAEYDAEKEQMNDPNIDAVLQECDEDIQPVYCDVLSGNNIEVNGDEYIESSEGCESSFDWNSDENEIENLQPNAKVR